jgi:hypothetical protein
VVAPLLTGFALATIALLLTSTTRPRLTDWAAVAFTATVAFLLFSMQVAFLALARSPSPADILTWEPQVAISAEALQQAREQQAADFHDMARLWKLCGHAYDAGIVSFLAGLLLLLIPHHWTLPRVAAITVAGIALAGELWWTVANASGQVPHPVVHDSDPASFKTRLAPLDSVGSASVLDATRSAPQP